MKKAIIPIMSALLVATLFTGCRKNVATTDTTGHTTNTTTATNTTATNSTHSTTKPTQETTRPSTQTTKPDQMPSMLPEMTTAPSETGRRTMPPRR